jgi:hypothetical protein
MSTTEAPGDTDALVERLVMASIDALEIVSIHVGGRLGFYRALADDGPATPASSRRARERPSAMCASGSSSRRWRAS